MVALIKRPKTKVPIKAIVTSLIVLLVLLYGTFAAIDEFDHRIVFPFLYELCDHHYAYIFGMQARVLEFEYDGDSGVLTVNSVRIYPPVYEPAPPWSEEKAWSVYGDTPFFKKYVVEVGMTALAAKGLYSETRRSFSCEVRNIVNRHGGPRGDVETAEREIRALMDQGDYGLIYYPECGAEIYSSYVVVAGRIGNGFDVHIPLKDPRDINIPEAIRTEARARAIVRQIVRFYERAPGSPHMAFIGQCGAGRMVIGDNVDLAMKQIEKSIAQLFPEPGGQMLGKHLRYIIDGVERLEELEHPDE